MTKPLLPKKRVRALVTPEVEAAYHSCEERLQNHSSHLLDAARKLEDPRRRDAFYATYVSLRIQAPACLPRPLGRARGLENSLKCLRAWSDSARLCVQGPPQSKAPSAAALADAMQRFQIPVRPWLDLEAGLADIGKNESPEDMRAFFVRGRNLALAPSSVFIRILCSNRGTRRYHMAREIDVYELSHDPALFAYLVGVISDVFNELDPRKHTASSIPAAFLERHGLSAGTLWAMRSLPEAPPDFLSLMQDLALFAWKFYESGVAKLTQAAALIPSDAIHYLDGFLDHYKVVLKNVERSDFSPRELSQLTGGLEPRIGAGMPAPDSGNNGLSPR